MSLRPAVRTLAVVAVVALAWAIVAGQDAGKYRLKPGATGSSCLSCHVEFEDTVGLPHVHTPVREGNCVDCHDPHASDHGKLLAADPDAICTTCHDDIAPDEALSVHEDVKAGRCVSCHDPHASRYPDQLLARGNDLCAKCHDEVTDTVQRAAFKHAPAESDCLGCHVPHASTEGRSLLARGVPGLCLGCHNAERPQFVKDHLGYPVGESNCASCHDPHGSSNKGILWASVHEPITRRMCAQCHAEAGAADALALRREGAQLCAGCHNDLMNEIGLKARPHWPVVDDRACGNCHSPHASKTTGLLVAEQKELCGDCHEDSIRRFERSQIKHEPIAEGDCSMCHEPHASDATYLLAAADDIELCANCHEWKAHSTHPIGDEVLDQRNGNLRVDCLSCHRTHGSAFDKLAFYNPTRDLCTECHTGFRR